jgi:hypothetical protein
MEHISRHTGINIGGVNPVYFVFADEINTFSVTTGLEATITLNEGKDWKHIYGTDGSIVIESKEEDTAAGIHYTYQVDIMIPKDRVDVEINLMEMSNRPVVFLAKDKNGTVRLFGRPENPMRKKAKLTWPAETEGFNGTKLSFSGSFSDPAAYVPSLNSEIPLADPILPAIPD